jgi:hypothetical protein
MDDTWDVTEDREQNVDEQVAAAATLKEDTDGWQENGNDDFADVTKMEPLSVWVRHDRGIAGMLTATPNSGSLTYDAVKGIVMVDESKDSGLV